MKRIITAIAVVMIMFILCIHANASSAENGIERLKNQIDTELSRAIDEDTAKDMDELGVTPSDAAKLDMRGFFGWLWGRFREVLCSPVVMLGRILAVSLLYSAVTFLTPENRELSSTYGSISVIAVITVMADTLSSSYSALQDSISCINRFMLTYIPVFSAVSASSGNPMTAGAYSSSTVLLCEAAEFVASGVLVPFMSLFMAIAVVSALNTHVKLSGAADAIRRLTTWLLAALMLVFVGLLTIQGVTCSAADSVAAKTIRFTASSFIPVIGSSVSDAYLAVKSGVGVIRAAVGGFGMTAIFLIALRPFLLLLSMRLTLWAGRIANEFLGLRPTAELLKTMDNVMAVGGSILIAITSAFIIATAAVMSFMTMG
ncbi:stage III sporulation protein AE [Ruminococcus albus]|uniref:Stage III sporulation protein AE n=1 Tax=Ruminococcus albus TaxID=1264 RepID=A0A1I1E2L2_RUMAL|nr:sporulation protein [Ruminococcus albus]SFB81455.1 stage III sporulation protein AE [Ruminococcus albus]